MADHIRYDLLTQEALRGVVRHVLEDAAKNGLPGEHHFYITFLTHADGAKVSARLREKFPEEMTIILQHQFWDLAVREESFQVGLSFGGVPEMLTVPFTAVRGFFDPSVQFGLTFEDPDKVAAEDSSGAKETAKTPLQEPQAANVAPLPAPAPAERTLKVVEDDDGKEPTGGGEVVRLDRFRKK